MRFRGRSAVPVALQFSTTEAGARGWRLDRQVALGCNNPALIRKPNAPSCTLRLARFPRIRCLHSQVWWRKASRTSLPSCQSLPKDRKVRYFISSQFSTSHSRGHSIYLPLARVANQSAPYLHETVHSIVPCPNCPMWFSEGFASFVQSYVSEHMGGYDGIIFARQGNRGIDRDALRWLANERGQAVLPFIGKPEEPPQINEDRSNVAAPFYVMAQSLVKYIVENTASIRFAW